MADQTLAHELDAVLCELAESKLTPETPAETILSSDIAPASEPLETSLLRPKQIKRRKFAVLIGYSGKGFHGIQL